MTKSGCLQTKYMDFAGGFDVLKGSVKNLRAGKPLQDESDVGYAVRFEPKHGSYINWPKNI